MFRLFNSTSLYLLTFMLIETNAQTDLEQNRSNWSFYTSFQVSGGSYFYNEYSSLYFLYGGLRYHSDNWSVYGYIPVVAQNNQGFTQSGMMIIPTGTENRNGSNHHSSMTSMSMLNMNFSLGDLFVYGSYSLLNEYDNPVELSVNPGIKFPTALGNTRIGTGKFDYSISFNARNSIETVVFLADAGFIKFGDPAGIDYKDPFTYGIGLGKFISENGNNIVLYFNSYTKVLNEYEPPRQLSLGLNFKLGNTKILSFIGSKGFSNYSPDFSASAGMSFGL